jgi:hypothetical protein
MAHHSGHLTFVPRGVNHSPVYIHRAAGKCKSIDVTGIHNLEVVLKLAMLEFGRDCADQAFAPPVRCRRVIVRHAVAGIVARPPALPAFPVLRHPER